MKDSRTALKISFVARAAKFEVRRGKRAKRPNRASPLLYRGRAAAGLAKALASMRLCILRYAPGFLANFYRANGHISLTKGAGTFEVHSRRYAFIRGAAHDSPEEAQHLAHKGRFWRLLMMIVLLSGCMFKGSVPQERYDRAMQLVDEGTIQLRQGKLDQALVAFTMAYEIAPVAAAVDGQGCVALLQGRYNEAEGLFDKAYGMDRGYDNALGNLALLMEITGRSAVAEKYYNQVVTAFPEHPGFRNNRAVLEYDRGERKMLVVQELKKAGLVAEHGVVKANLELLGHGPLGVVDESLLTTTAKMGEAESWQRK